jgi:hypothetical protein
MLGCSVNGARVYGDAEVSVMLWFTVMLGCSVKLGCTVIRVCGNARVLGVR